MIKPGVTALLTIQGLLLAWGASVHSPTYDEPGHLVAGMSYRQLGRFDVYKVNPPLPRLVASLPVELAGARTDWRHLTAGPGTRSELRLGEDFVAANGERALWLITLGRWACIPFTLMGGYVLFRWSRELYGAGAGLLALALWCFCPNILAHAQLMTCDAPAMSVGLAACYMFWRWLRVPTWPAALLSGLWLGLALVTKMSLLVHAALWPVLWVLYRNRDPETAQRPRPVAELRMLTLGILATGLYVTNACYNFEGSGTPLGELRFVSSAFRHQEQSGQSGIQTGNPLSDSWLGRCPAPLPKNYILGIDLQQRVFESSGQYAYLGTRFDQGGWWYHYLYALAMKVPLGTWILFGLAVVERILPGRRKSSIVDVIVLLPGVALLVAVSMHPASGGQIRYALPAFPFIFVWISGGVAGLCRRRRAYAVVTSVALVWSVGSSVSLLPHSVSYFNELGGGPRNGHAHLINSNIDWGQDMLYLRSWLRKRPQAHPLHLAAMNSFDPDIIGIEGSLPPAIPTDLCGSRVPSTISGRRAAADLKPGWYAVSVNALRGLHFGSTDAENRRANFAYFLRWQPVATAGYSIYIYRLSQADIERLRADLELEERHDAS